MTPVHSTRESAEWQTQGGVHACLSKIPIILILSLLLFMLYGLAPVHGPGELAERQAQGGVCVWNNASLDLLT